MATVLFYNHNLGGETCERVAGWCEAEVTGENSRVYQISDANYVIGHFSDRQRTDGDLHPVCLDTLVGKDNRVTYKLSVPWQCVLVLTTEPGGRREAHNVTFDAVGVGRRFVLFGRRPSEMQRAETLTAFLEMTQEQAQAVVDNRPEAVPDSLKSLLGLRRDRANLMAMFLVCQAFLLLRAGYETSGVTQAPATAAALERLAPGDRLHVVMRSASAIAPRGDWWHSTIAGLSSACGNFIAQLETEWSGPLPGSFGLVKTLVDMSLKAQDVPIEVVAGAFCALADDLGLLKL
jgi:hypothetical protein